MIPELKNGKRLLVTVVTRIVIGMGHPINLHPGHLITVGISMVDFHQIIEYHLHYMVRIHPGIPATNMMTCSDALLKELEYVATRPLLSDLDALRPGIASSSSGYASNMSMPGATLCTLEVAVPENLMPGFMGRGRYSIMDIEEISGARLDASDQCIPGTMNHRIVIHGNISTAQAAHSMVMQRIERDQDRRGTY